MVKSGDEVAARINAIASGRAHSSLDPADYGVDVRKYLGAKADQRTLRTIEHEVKYALRDLVAGGRAVDAKALIDQSGRLTVDVSITPIAYARSASFNLPDVVERERESAEEFYDRSQVALSDSRRG